MIPLLPDGRAQLVDDAQLRAMPWSVLVAWCYRNGRYGLVTTELVRWLQQLIGGRKAIEVGAGNGDLGFHLGIPQTDSDLQSDIELAGYYAMLGQAPTKPPPDVERIDANAAVVKYAPQVVVSSWLMQRYQDGDAVGSVCGADEIAIIEAVQTYVHIGNELVHGTKRALALRHKVYEFPWLWSRARAPDLNRIWIWGQQ